MATKDSSQPAGGFGADADKLMADLADRLGKGARAAAVFGEPVERDGVTVIPVAKARWGLGGGVGTDGRASATAEAAGGEAAGGDEATGGDEAAFRDKVRARGWGGRAGRGGAGTGGGGGAMVVPAGYIEIKAGKTDYHPIIDPAQVAIVGTIATAVVLVVWGLARAVTH